MLLCVAVLAVMEEPSRRDRYIPIGRISAIRVSSRSKSSRCHHLRGVACCASHSTNLFRWFSVVRRRCQLCDRSSCRSCGQLEISFRCRLLSISSSRQCLVSHYIAAVRHVANPVDKFSFCIYFVAGSTVLVRAVGGPRLYACLVFHCRDLVLHSGRTSRVPINLTLIASRVDMTQSLIVRFNSTYFYHLCSPS